MRFSLAVIVAALASSTSANLASRQGGLPACAMPCLTTANFGDCQPTENACLCRSNTFIESSTLCIGNACTGADLQAALDAAKQLCAIVGVTLTSTPAGFPTDKLGSATTAAASTTATDASPASTSSTDNAASINGASKVAGIAAIGLAALVL